MRYKITDKGLARVRQKRTGVKLLGETLAYPFLRRTAHNSLLSSMAQKPKANWTTRGLREAIEPSRRHMRNIISTEDVDVMMKSLGKQGLVKLTNSRPRTSGHRRGRIIR